MLLYTEFLNNIIDKFTSENLIIHITDAESQILASTDSRRPGTISTTARQVLEVIQPVKTKIINKNPLFPSSFGTPVYFRDELFTALWKKLPYREN